MTVYSGSRYAKSRVYTKLSTDGSAIVSVLGNRKTFIPALGQADPYVFKEGDRLDLISLREYGDSQLGWIILDANPKYMSEVDIIVGDIILIPKLSDVNPL